LRPAIKRGVTPLHLPARDGALAAGVAPADARKDGGHVIHTLLAIAVAVFVVWLVLTVLGAVAGGLIHLLWIVILVCLAVWAFRVLTGGTRGRAL
jgi:hypothetical protein